jgi:hypothetical protein
VAAVGSFLICKKIVQLTVSYVDDLVDQCLFLYIGLYFVFCHL